MTGRDCPLHGHQELRVFHDIHHNTPVAVGLELATVNVSKDRELSRSTMEDQRHKPTEDDFRELFAARQEFISAFINSRTGIPTLADAKTIFAVAMVHWYLETLYEIDSQEPVREKLDRDMLCAEAEQVAGEYAATVNEQDDTEAPGLLAERFVELANDYGAAAAWVICLVAEADAMQDHLNYGEWPTEDLTLLAVIVLEEINQLTVGPSNPERRRTEEESIKEMDRLVRRLDRLA